MPPKARNRSPLQKPHNYSKYADTALRTAQSALTSNAAKGAGLLFLGSVAGNALSHMDFSQRDNVIEVEDQKDPLTTDCQRCLNTNQDKDKLLQDEQDKNTQFKKEVDNLKSALNEKNTENDSLQIKLSQLQQTLSDKETANNQSRDETKTQKEQFEADNAALAKKLAILETRNTQLEQNISQSNLQYKEIITEQQALLKKNHELEKLNKTLQQQIETITEHKQQADRCQNEKKELEIKNEHLTTQSTKLTSQISQLTKDSENVQKVMNEMVTEHELQVRNLQEEKINLINDNEKLKQELKTCQAENQHLSTQHAEIKLQMQKLSQAMKTKKSNNKLIEDFKTRLDEVNQTLSQRYIKLKELNATLQQRIVEHKRQEEHLQNEKTELRINNENLTTKLTELEKLRLQNELQYGETITKQNERIEKLAYLLHNKLHDHELKATNEQLIASTLTEKAPNSGPATTQLHLQAQHETYVDEDKELSNVLQALETSKLQINIAKEKAYSRKTERPNTEKSTTRPPQSEISNVMLPHGQIKDDISQIVVNRQTYSDQMTNFKRELTRTALRIRSATEVLHVIEKFTLSEQEKHAMEMKHIERKLTEKDKELKNTTRLLEATNESWLASQAVHATDQEAQKKQIQGLTFVNQDLQAKNRDLTTQITNLNQKLSDAEYSFSDEIIKYVKTNNNYAPVDLMSNKPTVVQRDKIILQLMTRISEIKNAIEISAKEDNGHCWPVAVAQQLECTKQMSILTPCEVFDIYRERNLELLSYYATVIGMEAREGEIEDTYANHKNVIIRRLLDELIKYKEIDTKKAEERAKQVEILKNIYERLPPKIDNVYKNKINFLYLSTIDALKSAEKNEAERLINDFKQAIADAIVDSSGSTRVIVRIYERPVKTQSLTLQDNNRVVRINTNPFALFGVFWSASNKNENKGFFGNSKDRGTIAEVVQQVTSGYSVMVLTSGASGSGKTFTLFGKDKLPGIVELALKMIIGEDGRSNDDEIKANDSQTNARWPKLQRVTLTIKEDTMESVNLEAQDPLGTRIENRIKGKIETHKENVEIFNSDQTQNNTIESLLNNYNKYMKNVESQRKTKCRILYTPLNSESSRSHLFFSFSMIFETANKESLTGKLTFGDLAGQESPAEIVKRYRQGEFTSSLSGLMSSKNLPFKECDAVNPVRSADSSVKLRHSEPYVKMIVEQGVYIAESLNLFRDYILMLSGSQKKSEYQQFQSSEYNVGITSVLTPPERAVASAGPFLVQLIKEFNTSTDIEKPSKLVIIGTLVDKITSCNSNLDTLRFLQKLVNPTPEIERTQNVELECISPSKKRVPIHMRNIFRAKRL